MATGEQAWAGTAPVAARHFANANRARERDALPDGRRRSHGTERLIDEAKT